jgi:hypothetical protein
MQDILNSFTAGVQAYTPKQLQEFGQQAAAKHLQGGMPLADALHEVLVTNSGLNKDQVTRVTEAANIAVFQTRFGTEQEKNFEFDTAVPESVWGKLTANKLDATLNADAPPLAQDPGTTYQTPPPDYKADLGPSLESVFTPQNGGGDLPANDPIYEEVSGLIGSADEIGNESAKAASLQMRIENEAFDFLNKVASSFLGGTSVGDMVTICEHAAGGNVKVAAAVGEMILDHLRERGIAGADELQTSLGVVRHHIPNTEHEFYKAASRLTGLVAEQEAHQVKLAAAQSRRAAFLRGLEG